MIQIKNLTKSYTHQVLFSNVDLTFGEKEKVGIIGRNGTGKSTFIKMILGKEMPDEGNIEITPGFRIRSLEQHLNFSEDTLLEQVCSALPAQQEGFPREDWKAKSILMGLGFAEEKFDMPPSSFSGGYQIRIRLAEALVGDADMLLLDEPTNYLDIVSLRWLENFLKGWKNAFILITHDQEFMTKTVQSTVALHRGKMRKIKGSPQKVMDQILKDEQVYEKTRQNTIKKTKKTEEFIKNFRAGARSAGLVQSRIKSLAKQDTGEKLEYLPQIHFNFKAEPFRGTSLIELRNICFGYEPDTLLIDKFHVEIGGRQKIAIIGKNGKGKSTLLKIMGGYLEKNSGHIKKYHTLTTAYFGDEEKKALNPEHSILSEMLTVTGIKEMEARKICGSLLFSGNTVKKQIKFLSGGEKSRVLLGKAMLQKAHLLLLDEPTNHLDMESVQAITNAIRDFEGSAVIVSHDERLLKSVANRLIVFEPEKISLREQTYVQFLEADGWQEEDNIAAGGKEKVASDQKKKFLEKKELQKKIRLLQNQQKKIEEENISLQEELEKNSFLLHKAVRSADNKKISELGKLTKSADETIRNNEELLEELILEELEAEEVLLMEE